MNKNSAVYKMQNVIQNLKQVNYHAKLLVYDDKILLKPTAQCAR